MRMQLTQQLLIAAVCALTAVPQVNAAFGFGHSHGYSHSHSHSSSGGQRCVIQPVESAGNYYCGGVGSIDHQGYVYRRYTSSSLDECKEKCMETDKCESFAHHHSTGCILYTKNLRKQGFRTQSGGSTMYNRGCFSRTCSSTSSSTDRDAPVHLPPSHQQQVPLKPDTRASSSQQQKDTSKCEYSFCNSRLSQCRPFNVSTTSNTMYRAYPYAIAKSYIQSLASPAHTAPTLVRSFDPAFFPVCDAIGACSEVAANEKYYSFDLHFRFSSNRYECVLFKGRPDKKDCTWFSVADEDVSCSTGWGLEIIGQ